MFRGPPNSRLGPAQTASRRSNIRGANLAVHLQLPTTRRLHACSLARRYRYPCIHKRNRCVSSRSDAYDSSAPAAIIIRRPPPPPPSADDDNSPDAASYDSRRGTPGQALLWGFHREFCYKSPFFNVALFYCRPRRRAAGGRGSTTLISVLLNMYIRTYYAVG